MVIQAAKRAFSIAETFTEKEASDKIGTLVCLLVDHNNIRKGRIGHVVDFHQAAKHRFEVVIRWDGLSASEVVHERFSKTNYQRFIAEK